MSDRLKDALAAADVVYAEDTRRTSKLLAVLGINTPTRSYFVGNERQRSAELAQRLAEGANVVLVSDAGTPVVADPGFSAVRAADEINAAITVVPGPSAVTALLAVSGLSGDRFVFEGFLPRSGDERQERIGSMVADSRTTVFFSTGNRLSSDLADLAAVSAPDRRVVVGRELTKLHEHIWRGSMSEAVSEWSSPVRGEITVAIAGAERAAGSLDEAVTDALAMIDDGASMSDAVKGAAARHHLKKSAVYDAVLAARKSRQD